MPVRVLSLRCDFEVVLCFLPSDWFNERKSTFWYRIPSRVFRLPTLSSITCTSFVFTIMSPTLDGAPPFAAGFRLLSSFSTLRLTLCPSPFTSVFLFDFSWGSNFGGFCQVRWSRRGNAIVTFRVLSAVKGMCHIVRRHFLSISE